MVIPFSLKKSTRRASSPRRSVTCTAVALAWANAPEKTKSFVVFMIDPDGLLGQGVSHWLGYNIPANVKGFAEGELERGLVADAGREPIVTADHEHSCRSAVVAPPAEPRRERAAVEAFAALIENDRYGLFGNDVGERDRFFEHALADLLRAALLDFEHLDVAEADSLSGLVGALAVALDEFALRAVF